MRFMINASAGDRPDDTSNHPVDDPAKFETLFADYMRFNEQLHKAGVLVTAEGLTPDTKGARVGVMDGKRALMDGPFAESKELVGGFYVIEVDSLDEAVSWAMRCPVGLGTDNVLEIRQLTGMTDIPAELLALSHKVAPEWTASVTRPKK